MSVIDVALRFPHCRGMIGHEELRDELRRQIAAKRFTQRFVAQRLGIAPPRVKEMLLGTRRVQPDEMAKLAEILGVGVEHPPLGTIPLLGAVPGGNWREAVEDRIGTVPKFDPHIPSRAYALKVVGDSMNLEAPDGSTIVVDPEDTDLYAGHLFVVLNGDGEATFKRYEDAPARLVPCSTNPAHKEIPIAGGAFKVVGRVIWIAARR